MRLPVHAQTLIQVAKQMDSVPECRTTKGSRCSYRKRGAATRHRWQHGCVSCMLCDRVVAHGDVECRRKSRLHVQRRVLRGVQVDRVTAPVHMWHVEEVVTVCAVVCPSPALLVHWRVARRKLHDATRDQRCQAFERPERRPKRRPTLHHRNDEVTLRRTIDAATVVSAASAGRFMQRRVEGSCSSAGSSCGRGCHSSGRGQYFCCYPVVPRIVRTGVLAGASAVDGVGCSCRRCEP
jgi:hypothetical protein